MIDLNILMQMFNQKILKVDCIFAFFIGND